ncbi:MAG: HAD family phosphatase [Alphaproteobacteria bacterium]|nr:HAD family phosphatase [Alphaproteobacteria bacterium]
MSEIKLISFDFDLTLTKHKSAMVHFSHAHGVVDQVKQLEHEFIAGRITTHQFADASAAFFKNLSHDDIATKMADLVLIDDCLEVIEQIKSLGIQVIICSVGYRALIKPIAQKLNIEVFSGVDLAEQNQIYNGDLTGYFSEYNKITFVQRYALENNIELEQVMAVGDSATDVPLFNVVGKAVAFNANELAQKHAHHIVDGQSLKCLLPFIDL